VSALAGSGAVTLTFFTPGHPTRPSEVDFSFAAAGFVARDAVLPVNSTLTDSRLATVVVYSAAAFDSTKVCVMRGSREHSGNVSMTLPMSLLLRSRSLH
jgi:hypothetical protein